MKGHSGPCDAAQGGEDLCVACRAREPVTAETITTDEVHYLRAELRTRARCAEVWNALVGKVEK